MGILIDSSILIEHERGRLRLEPLLAGISKGEGFLSAITASELLHGVHRTREPANRARRLASVETVLGVFPILR